MRFPKFTPAQSATLELLGTLLAALVILAYCGPLVVHPAPEACQCPGVCEMAGCSAHHCPCDPQAQIIAGRAEAGKVADDESPCGPFVSDHDCKAREVETLWATLGVSDWGEVDESDLADPEVCETLDAIEALEGDQ
jgi:hypothetical protein